MPQLLLMAILAGAGYLVYRKFVSDAEKLAARSRDRQKEQETGAMGTLVQDPVTGEYRVRKD